MKFLFLAAALFSLVPSAYASDIGHSFGRASCEYKTSYNGSVSSRAVYTGDLVSKATCDGDTFELQQGMTFSRSLFNPVIDPVIEHRCESKSGRLDLYKAVRTGRGVELTTSVAKGNESRRLKITSNQLSFVKQTVRGHLTAGLSYACTFAKPLSPSELKNLAQYLGARGLPDVDRDHAETHLMLEMIRKIKVRDDSLFRPASSGQKRVQ